MKLGRPGQIYQAFFFTPASLSLSLTLSSLPPQFFQPILISIYYLYRSPRFFALLSEFSPSTSPSLLLRMLTYHSPHSTSFMNLSPIMYPVVRLIYILMGALLSIETIPSFFYSRGRATPVSISEISETRRERRRSWKWWPRSPRDG